MFFWGAVKGVLTGQIDLSSWQGTTEAKFRKSPIKFVYILVVRLIGTVVFGIAGIVMFYLK